MNGFERFIYNIQKVQIDYPPSYGWYHFVWLIFAVAALIFFTLFFRKKSATVIRIFVVVCSCVMLILEVFKQFVGVLRFRTDGTVVWDYYWLWFPFQLCSTPMYIGVVAGILCEGKVKSMLYNYLALFGFLGGFLVYLYPAQVFMTEILFILLQTMIHHLIMMIMGLTILTSKMELNHKAFLLALPVFLILVFIAVMLNIGFYYGYSKDIVMDLFSLSPFHSGFSIFPGIKYLLEHKMYVVFLLIYLVVFSALAYVFLLTAMFIQWSVPKLTHFMEVKWKNRKKRIPDVENGGMLLLSSEGKQIEAEWMDEINGNEDESKKTERNVFEEAEDNESNTTEGNGFEEAE